MQALPCIVRRTSTDTDRCIDVEVRQFISAPEVDDMSIHPGACFCGVTGAEGLQDLLVRKDKSLASVQARKDLQECRIEKLADRLTAELKSPVRRSIGNDLMKFDIEFDEALLVFECCARFKARAAFSSRPIPRGIEGILGKWQHRNDRR